MWMGEIVMPVGAPISVQAFRRDAPGMPGNPAKARLVQDIFVCFLGPIIVANVYRTTGGEHRNVEGGPLVPGTVDCHTRLVLFNARQLVDYSSELQRRPCCAPLFLTARLLFGPIDATITQSRPLEKANPPCGSSAPRSCGARSTGRRLDE